MPARLPGRDAGPFGHAPDVLPSVRLGHHEGLHAGHGAGLEGRRRADAAGRLSGHATRVLGPGAPDHAGEEVRD